MRDDLLSAMACVDWAVSQIPSLEERLNTWFEANVKLELEEIEPDSPKRRVVAVKKAELPLTFNAEVGAYINAMRSSLDLLATSLAHRYGVPDPDKHYFPIVPSKAVFDAGDYKGSKLIKGLPKEPRAKIESLKPYEGGNENLWFLHYLDIERKHRRLLVVSIRTGMFRVQGSGFTRHHPVWEFTDDKTILGTIADARSQPKMHIAPYVGIDEPNFGSKHVVAALQDFAGATGAAISLFDDP
jgi:hypothetical protein